MKKGNIGIIVLLYFLMMLPNLLFATDTLKSKKPNIRRDTLIFDDKFLGLRIGTGFQKSFYFEAGISYNRFRASEGYGFFNNSIYSVIEIIPQVRSQHAVYGFKIGGELGSMGETGGVEVKYLTDKIESDIVITPKLGIGLAGYLIISYGYNFSTNNRPFENIGRHQFSLISNIPPLKFFRKKRSL